MSEKYIERLQREKSELLAAIRASMDWHAAVDRLNNTAYKGDARKAVAEKREAMEVAHKKIEPLLAE